MNNEKRFAELDLDFIRKAQTYNQRRSSKFLKNLEVLEIVDAWLRLYLDCLNVAWELYHQGRDSTFMFAHLTLGGRLLSHYESIRTLMNRGLYGDALIIFRSILGTTYLVLDFYNNPKHIPLWLQLESFNPLTAPPPKQVRKIQELFREGELRKRLRRAGDDVEAIVDGSLYASFSEAVHPSAWGSQHFQRRNLKNPEESIVQFAPHYQTHKLVAVWFLLTDIPRYWVSALLRRLGEQGLESEKVNQLVTRYNRMFREQDEFRGKATFVMDKWKEAEERVKSGEEFEKAYSLEQLSD